MWRTKNSPSLMAATSWRVEHNSRIATAAVALRDSTFLAIVAFSVEVEEWRRKLSNGGWAVMGFYGRRGERGPSDGDEISRMPLASCFAAAPLGAGHVEMARPFECRCPAREDDGLLHLIWDGPLRRRRRSRSRHGGWAGHRLPPSTWSVPPGSPSCDAPL